MINSNLQKIPTHILVNMANNAPPSKAAIIDTELELRWQEVAQLVEEATNLADFGECYICDKDCYWPALGDKLSEKQVCSKNCLDYLESFGKVNI